MTRTADTGKKLKQLRERMVAVRTGALRLDRAALLPITIVDIDAIDAAIALLASAPTGSALEVERMLTAVIQRSAVMFACANADCKSCRNAAKSINEDTVAVLAALRPSAPTGSAPEEVGLRIARDYALEVQRAVCVWCNNDTPMECWNKHKGGWSCALPNGWDIIRKIDESIAALRPSSRLRIEPTKEDA